MASDGCPLPLVHHSQKPQRHREWDWNTITEVTRTVLTWGQHVFTKQLTQPDPCTSDEMGSLISHVPVGKLRLADTEVVQPRPSMAATSETKEVRHELVRVWPETLTVHLWEAQSSGGMLGNGTFKIDF